MTVALAHDVRGSGPLLVLVHGITENRHSWDPLTDDLARDHRVVRVDLRGHGESPAAESYDLAEYADDIAALPVVDDSALMVGHSLGGAVVTAYAAAHPVAGTVNVDQPLDLAAMQAQLQSVESMLRGEQFADFMYATFDTMRGTLADDEWQRLTELRRPDRDVVLGTWSLMLDTDPGALAAAVDATMTAVRGPYLAIDGTDPGDGHAGWLTDRIPQAHLEVWDGRGHYPHLAEPDRFLARVREFEQSLG